MKELIIVAIVLFVLLRLDLRYSKLQPTQTEARPTEAKPEVRLCMNALQWASAGPPAATNEAVPATATSQADESAPHSRPEPAGATKSDLSPLPPGTRYVQHIPGDASEGCSVSYSPLAKPIVEAQRKAFPERWYEARDELEDGTEVSVN